MNDYKSVVIEHLYKIIDSEYKYIIIALFLLIFALSITTAVIIIQRINFKDTLVHLKEMTVISYNHLDQKAKKQLISRIQRASNESELKIKFSFMETLDLKLIERSNIRNYIPLLNIYVLIFATGCIFFLVVSPIYTLFSSWKTAIVLAILVSLVPAIILDTLTVYNISRTRKMTANFLTLLLGWLEVKNDLRYALEHVKDDVGAPFCFYINDAVVQLKSGIEPSQVFDILSYKINTEQFYMITMNFKSSFKNGGDILELVKVLEEEAYMIDNEFETRVVDTFSTRMLLNVLLFSAMFFLFVVVLNSPTYNAIYTEDPGGKNALFIATSIFVLGFLLNLKTEKHDY